MGLNYNTNKIVKIILKLSSFITTTERSCENNIVFIAGVYRIPAESSGPIGLNVTSLGMRTTRGEPFVRPASSPIADGSAINAYRTDESRSPKAKARLAPCTSAFSPALSRPVAGDSMLNQVLRSSGLRGRRAAYRTVAINLASRREIRDDTPRWHWRDNRKSVTSWRNVGCWRCARSDDGISSQNCVAVRETSSLKRETGGCTSKQDWRVQRSLSFYAID